MKTHHSAFLIIIFITLITNTAHAFRCGQEIIGRWDTAQSCIDKCGNPSQKTISNQNVNGLIQPVENWFYNCGEQDFIYQVTIHNQKIISEMPITRGSGPNECKK